MNYTAQITTRNPTCFLFLVDQSGSMKLPFGRDRSVRKADGVAEALNRLLDALVSRCSKGEKIADRYYIGVIGYGSRIGSGLGGELAGQGLVPVSRIGSHPLRIEERVRKERDGAGGVREAKVIVTVWIEPVADGRTTLMCGALAEAQKTVRSFVTANPNSFPPIVINITDGEAKDGDPEAAAAALREITTADGNVLLFNVHISSDESSPILFPSDEGQLPDKFSQRLFRMSSPLPPKMIEEAQSMEYPVIAGARGFVFNADLDSVVHFLDIGTALGPKGN
ncbi:MAG: VWA domain-containing protein [Planctomycetota bacterium]|nr:VWA domain-containing protein [Planctomycetota bacterium]